MLPTRFTFPSPGFSHYWNEGHGKKMLARLTSIPTRLQVEQNASLLMQADTLADEVIKEVFEAKGFKQAHEMIAAALNNGVDAVPDAPESFKQLMREADAIPAWLDANLLKAGSDFCTRSGSLGLVVLRNYCLMGGYESSAINKPLIYTQALKKGAAKRMAETIEFWVSVTGAGAMQKGAIGFKSCVQLRLMHAYARVSVQRMPDWRNAQWGLPINHGDMIATNLGFSLVFMHGLRRLGFRPTAREVKGIFHLWKYIGYLIGIPVEYLPDTEERAIESLYKWTISQPPADADTIALAHALKDEPIYASFPRYGWQKNLLIKLHLAYNHFFLGPRACSIMALPGTLFKYYPYAVAVLNGGVEFIRINVKGIYKISVATGRKQQVIIKTLFLRIHEQRNKAEDFR